MGLSKTYRHKLSIIKIPIQILLPKVNYISIYKHIRLKIDVDQILSKITSMFMLISTIVIIKSISDNSKMLLNEIEFT